MLNLPLLHIVQTTARITTLDARVLVLGLCIAGAVITWVWLPARTRRRLLQRRRGRYLASLLVRVAVVFAVLPAVLPYDHIFVHHDEGSDDDTAVHQMHCHLSPGSCSDVPINSGPGGLIFTDAFQPDVRLTTSMLREAVVTAVESLEPVPDTPPPRA